MKKSYVIMLYIVIILLASVGVGVLVWKDTEQDTIEQKYYEKYFEIKEKLLEVDTYSTESEDIDVNVKVSKVNDSYLVNTTFTNPKDNYKNLTILVIDQSEKEKETDKIYPSLGIVGNFNNEFVVSAPNKKTTHSTLSMNYESNVESKGVLVYLEYTHNSDIVISRLSVSVN